jgi:nucleoside-diphosphate-sugar epimerase
LALPPDRPPGRSSETSLVALTGATGFIGNAVLSQLTGAGWRVRALYRPRAGRAPPALPSVEWIAGGLDSDDSLRALVAGAHAVVHCAGVVRGARRADFDRVNAEGTARLARAAAAGRSRAPRFLLMSSLAAREPGLSHYAASKRRGETALSAMGPALRWSVLRPPAVYGPGERELAPLFRWIARGVAPLPSGAAGRFSLLYVDDLAAAVLHWLDADAGDARIFELDDGRAGGYDWDTVLTTAARVLRGGAPVRRLAVPAAFLRVAARANLAAGTLLGYAPMLTPGKLREISHPDWLCDSHDFAEATGWRATVLLERGLVRAYGRRGPGTT